ncbi:hypothetical protein [Thiomicrorhabdus sp.]|uniref:hypothetical protein n=1 Tax=Thiomicrorhabdus sp. TaxID=2039724 RepID=UPI0029C84B78|nr:hypothetical protein [Thiomicrorhabdus sp.]
MDQSNPHANNPDNSDNPKKFRPALPSALPGFLYTGLILTIPFNAQASHTFTLGAWYNYANENDNLPTNTYTKNGEFGDGAVIFYMDGQAEPNQGIWSYSAELRTGPGSFSDTKNNGTGHEFSLHKAWLGLNIDEQNKLVIGKSQVPFGWKTSNFWPGDMYQAGYGDQMDVGIKLQGTNNRVGYNLAYYLSDDWSSTSTDTTDDNRHWGSSDSYRKRNTLVGDVHLELFPQQTLGISLQTGGLEDLTPARTSGLKIDNDQETDGHQSAAVIYYQATFGKSFVNAEAIKTYRTLPSDLAQQDGLIRDRETSRYALEIGRNRGNWTYYLDATWAESQTENNHQGTISAYAPGIRYNYGPGWIYAEYLTQNGYIDRFGDIVDSDYEFNALYLSIDWYFSETK